MIANTFYPSLKIKFKSSSSTQSHKTLSHKSSSVYHIEDTIVAQPKEETSPSTTFIPTCILLLFKLAISSNPIFRYILGQFL